MLVALAAVAIATAIFAGRRRAAKIEERLLAARPVGPDGIVSGAEAIDLASEGRAAVLLLHGGGDTPQVVRGLALHLYERGFAVRAPLLSGHGRTLSAFARVRAADWHDEVRRAYEELGARYPWVAVVGLSVGGALAVRLAAERSDVPALVLLAPYVAIPLSVQLAARTSRLWGLITPYMPSRGERSIHDPAAARAALGYGYFTPAALRAVMRVVSDARASLGAVTAPTLVVQSRQDNRIAAIAAQDAFGCLGALEKRFEWIDGAGHVITVDFGHARVFELVTKWLEQHRRAGNTTAKGPR